MVGLYTLIETSSWERVRFGWFWIGLVSGHIVWNVTSGGTDMVKHARLVSFFLGLFRFSISSPLRLLYILQSFSPSATTQPRQFRDLSSFDPFLLSSFEFGISDFLFVCSDLVICLDISSETFWDLGFVRVGCLHYSVYLSGCATNWRT